MAKKQFRTTVLIDDDKAPLNDLEYIKSKGLKPTNLLRVKIKELRLRDEGAPTVKGLQKNMKALQAKLQKFCEAMEQTLSKEDFDKILAMT